MSIYYIISSNLRFGFFFIARFPSNLNLFFYFQGVSICFNMLKHALCGSYVNFGVFRLYGDSALDDAFNTFVKLLLSISQVKMMLISLMIKSGTRSLPILLYSFGTFFPRDVESLMIMSGFRSLPIVYCIHLEPF